MGLLDFLARSAVGGISRTLKGGAHAAMGAFHGFSRYDRFISGQGLPGRGLAYYAGATLTAGVRQLDRGLFSVGSTLTDLAFNRTRPSLVNAYIGLQAKPWLIGAVVGYTLFSSAATGSNISSSISAQPVPSMPSLTWDGMPNLPDNLGATGDLALAAHANRHG